MVQGGGFQGEQGTARKGKVPSQGFRGANRTYSIAALQYNILSLSRDSMTMRPSEGCSGRWRRTHRTHHCRENREFVMETVIAIVNLFGLTDEEVLEMGVCRSDELAHLCRTFELKVA